MDLPSRLSKELSGVIQSDERVLDFLYGLRSQCAVLTDRRVVVTKRGINAGAVLGSKTTSYPLEMIVGVEVRTSSFRTALIVLTANDQMAKGTGYWQQPGKNIWNAPNTVPLNRADREMAQQFAEHVQRLRKQSLHYQRRGPLFSQSSVADELAKLANLRADGVLSEEEFAAQKAKLLS